MAVLGARTQVLPFCRAVGAAPGSGATGPTDRARELLRWWLEEVEAVEGARISHGAIQEKFTVLAATRRRRRRRLWRATGREEGLAVVDALCATVAALGERVAAADPAHKPLAAWLDEALASGPGATDTGEPAGPRARGTTC